MAIVFTDVTKCKAVQRNQFRNDKVMATHIVAGQFRVMAQNNKMMGQMIID